MLTSATTTASSLLLVLGYQALGDFGPTLDGLAGEHAYTRRDGGSLSNAGPVPQGAPLQDLGPRAYVARAHDQGAVQLGLLADRRLPAHGAPDDRGLLPHRDVRRQNRVGPDASAGRQPHIVPQDHGPLQLILLHPSVAPDIHPFLEPL